MESSSLNRVSRPRPINWVMSSLLTTLLANPILALVSVLPSSKAAADYYVHSLPGQPDGPLLKMHAGHIEVNPDHNGNLFFWHFQNRHIDNRQRTVIWLNGGPGCSSMDGALMEVGPYRVKPDRTLEYNEGSWDEFANLLFVDNPVGTGFSYVDTDSYLHELKEMADQFILFLEKWFQSFPEYEQDEIYIAGESYAGQHIPYIAKAILDRNKKSDSNPDSHPWNLRGLLIGNGWIAPAEQYSAYLTYAYKEGLIKSGSDASKRVEAQMSICLNQLSQSDSTGTVSIPSCEKVLTDILKESVNGNECINMYDIRLTDSYPSCGMHWPPDLSSITPYLRQKNVTDALHVTPGKQGGWTECTGKVSEAFKARDSRPAIELLPELLESGIRVLLFSGDRDFICNHFGTEEFIHNMKWSGGTGFELSPGVWAPRHDWTFEGEPAGIYQEARNLTYLLYYNASHMVPFDFPRRTREMLDQFIRVNITNIGGAPADSRIDGTKTTPTSVGGHPNSTFAQQEEKEKLKEATWRAYYKSGEVVLVIVIIIAAVWGFFIWRARRRRQGSGYRGIYSSGNASDSGSVLPRFRNKPNDIEATDFDEGELDNLRVRGSAPDDRERDNYSIGDESSDEDEKVVPKGPKSILKKPTDTENRSSA